MKKLSIILACLAVLGGIGFGILASKSAANETIKLPAQFAAPSKYTIVQETRTIDGQLKATEIRVFDNGKYYYRHTNAETGLSMITLLTDSGGYMNNKDETAPARLVRVREPGQLMIRPSALLTPAGWESQQGFQRFAEYQGQIVAVKIDDVGEHWAAPALYPSTLRMIRPGLTTETTKLAVGEADPSFFVVPSQ